MRETVVYAPVYLTEGRLWPCACCVRSSREEVEEAVKKTAETLPEWAKANVFQRIAKFRLVEVVEE